MNPTTTAKEKELTALRSVDWVKDGMVVGLGSGSTAAYMIRALGSEVAKGLSIQGVPSSERSAELARKVGIPLTTLAEVSRLDINIDGADEFDPQFRLIKGGGGALLREKILAHNSRFNLIIADSGKQVDALGAFKLPIETIPFATQSIHSRLEKMDLKPILRIMDGRPYTTDENNYILDVDMRHITDARKLNDFLIGIPGVVETGLFLDSTDIIIMGKGSKTIILENNTLENRNPL